MIVHHYIVMVKQLYSTLCVVVMKTHTISKDITEQLQCGHSPWVKDHQNMFCVSPYVDTDLNHIQKYPNRGRDIRSSVVVVAGGGIQFKERG